MKHRIYTAVLCSCLMGILCTGCGKPKEYSTADLPLQSFDMTLAEDATLPFALKTITLPVESGKIGNHIVVNGDVFFALNHREFAISSKDIELMHYDGESGALTQLFAYQDDTNGMEFVEFTAVGQYVYLLAYENEPYDEDMRCNRRCEVWQIDTQTLAIRTVNTLEIDKTQYMRHALFATADGKLCFAYSLRHKDKDITKVTERIYDPAADTWETVKVINHEDGDYVANRDENFVCNTDGDAAVFSYGEAYILTTQTENPLYEEGTADYVNWAERFGEGDDKYYYFYHFDAKLKQLYRTKVDTLGHNTRSAGDYVMLWRNAGDTLGVFCLLPETGQLVPVSNEGFSTNELTYDNDDFTFVMQDKRDGSTAPPMIAYIENWRE